MRKNIVIINVNPDNGIKKDVLYRVPDLQFDLFAIYSDHPRSKLYPCI